MTTTRRSKKEKLAKEGLTLSFIGACKVGFPVLGLGVCLAFIVPFLSDTVSMKLLVAKLAQISLGIVFAISQLFLGVLLALIGISSDYELEAGAGDSRIKLVSASPGILLIIASNVLIVFCLARPIEAEDRIEQSVPQETANLDTKYIESTNVDKLGRGLDMGDASTRRVSSGFDKKDE